MEVQDFIFNFFKVREINPFDAFLILNSSLKEFYEACTGNSFDDLSEDSEEFGVFLMAHFKVKTDPLYVNFFSDLQEGYITDAIEEQRQFSRYC
jgi:hypothetical protein